MPNTVLAVVEIEERAHEFVIFLLVPQVLVVRLFLKELDMDVVIVKAWLAGHFVLSP